MSKKSENSKNVNVLASSLAGYLKTPMDFIAYALIEVADGVTKAAAARALDVSTRTVGRMVDRTKAALEAAQVQEFDGLSTIKGVHKELVNLVGGFWLPFSTIVKSLRNEGVPPVWSVTPAPVPETEAEPVPVVEAEPVPEGEAEYSFVLTGRSLVLSRHPLDGTDPESVTILSTDDRFAAANQRLVGIVAITDEAEKNAAVAELFKENSITEQLKSMDFGKVHVDFNAGTVEVEISSGERVPATGAVVQRILTAENPDHLVKFLDRLYENPSYSAITGLFEFLQATDIDIDEEGYVIALKVITHDYLDCHTRTFDNSIGATVKMDRRLVDDNPKSLCSSGLHACSESYVAGFRSGDSRLVKVRIDPKDFVSVPEAYTKTVDGGSVASKARVCEYVVIEEVI